MIASFFKLYAKTAKNPRLTKTGYKKAKADPLKIRQSPKNAAAKKETSLKFPLSKIPLSVHKIPSATMTIRLNRFAKNSAKG